MSMHPRTDLHATTLATLFLPERISLAGYGPDKRQPNSYPHPQHIELSLDRDEIRGQKSSREE